MFGNTPIVKTIQSDATDPVGLAEIEISACEFPWLAPKISQAIRDPKFLAVRSTVDYKKTGWCLFSVTEGGCTIDIERIVAYNNQYLFRVIESIINTLSWSPKPIDRVHVKTVWPEYGTDSHIFKALLNNGFKAVGLDRDAYRAYGTIYDGLNLERIIDR